MSHASRTEAQPTDDANVVDRCFCEKANAQVILAHLYAAEVMSADQVDGRLDRVVSKWPALPKPTNQLLKQPAQTSILATEVVVDGT